MVYTTVLGILTIFSFKNNKTIIIFILLYYLFSKTFSNRDIEMHLDKNQIGDTQDGFCG